MTLKGLLLLLSAVCVCVAAEETASLDPLGRTKGRSGYGKPPDQICNDFGYPVETHVVTTDDGYILNLYRIASSMDSASKGIVSKKLGNGIFGNMNPVEGILGNIMPGGGIFGNKKPGGDESSGNKNPGSESNGNKNPGSSSNDNKNPGSASNGNKNPGSASNGNKNPGSTSNGNKNPGSASNGNKNPGSASNGNKNPGSTSNGNMKPVSESSSDNRPVVLLVHGMLTNAGSWFAAGEQSLPFQLADENIDVWLGCPRGTIYSRSHVSMSADTKEFWDFSFQENGVYDIPAMISYITSETDQDQMLFVTHSTGGAMFSVFCSEMQQACQDSIKGAYLMAPAIYMTHSKGMFQSSAGAVHSHRPMIHMMSTTLKHDEFQMSSESFRSKAIPFCTSAKTSPSCRDTLQQFFGPEAPGELGQSELHKLFTSTPDSISFKQLTNISQGVQNPDMFTTSDSKTSEQNRPMNVTRAPNRNMVRNVDVPVSLYYGSNDHFTVPKDIKEVSRDLPQLRRMVKIDRFTHIDFLFGKSASSQMYTKLMHDIMEDCERSENSPPVESWSQSSCD